MTKASGFGPARDPEYRWRRRRHRVEVLRAIPIQGLKLVSSLLVVRDPPRQPRTGSKRVHRDSGCETSIMNMSVMCLAQPATPQGMSGRGKSAKTGEKERAEVSEETENAHHRVSRVSGVSFLWLWPARGRIARSRRGGEWRSGDSRFARAGGSRDPGNKQRIDTSAACFGISWPFWRRPEAASPGRPCSFLGALRHCYKTSGSPLRIVGRFSRS